MNMSLTSVRSNHAGSRPQHVVRTVRDLYQQLSNETDLRPRPAVNDLFSSLVSTVLSVPDATGTAALADSDLQAIVPNLRKLCGRGEYELEAAWARSISASPRPLAELDRFPYLANYRQLCRMELGVLASAASAHVGTVAFLGSGPLPLSSILLAQQANLQVDNIDHDETAVALGRQLVEATNTANICFQTDDAAAADLAGYDVVVLAAMVGSTPEEKLPLLHSICRSMSPGALLLARSTRGLRTLLYPTVPAEALTGFEVLTVVHPVNDVLNSVILARARA